MSTLSATFGFITLNSWQFPKSVSQASGISCHFKPKNRKLVSVAWTHTTFNLIQNFQLWTRICRSSLITGISCRRPVQPYFVMLQPCPWLFSKKKLTGLLTRLRAYCQEKTASKLDNFHFCRCPSCAWLEAILASILEKRTSWRRHSPVRTPTV